MPVLGALGPLLGLLAGRGIGALFWQLTVVSLAEVPRHSFWNSRIAAPDDATVFVPVLT